MPEVERPRIVQRRLLECRYADDYQGRVRPSCGCYACTQIWRGYNLCKLILAVEAQDHDR